MEVIAETIPAALTDDFNFDKLGTVNCIEILNFARLNYEKWSHNCDITIALKTERLYYRLIWGHS